MDMNEYQQLLEHKVHTTETFPYNTYLCTIPLDFTCVPTHWHDEIELIIIKKGEGLVSVDLIEYHVHAGDMVIVLPGHLHSIQEKAGRRMEYENILFRKELLLSKKDDLCTTELLDPLFHDGDLTDCYIHAAIPYYDDMAHVIQAIDTVCSKRPVGYQLAVKGYLFQFFFLIITNHNKMQPDALEQKRLDKIKLVIKYIEQHYQEPISLSDMAALCYYSESHFMKFFKQNMKESFVSYLNQYRLTIAARLLTTTTDPILEIAEKVGFDNLSYFNRIFKKRYGITPKQMR